MVLRIAPQNSYGFPFDFQGTTWKNQTGKKRENGIYKKKINFPTKAKSLPALVVEVWLIKNKFYHLASIKEQNLIMNIFQKTCVFFLLSFFKDIKKKRKLFLVFKLLFQSSFNLNSYVAVYSFLKISSWFFGIEILINFPFSYSFWMI